MSIREFALRNTVLRALRLVHPTGTASVLSMRCSTDDDNSMRVPVEIGICFHAVRKFPPPIVLSTHFRKPL